MVGIVNFQVKELIENPREDMNVEIKCWLDFDENSSKAKVARAIIALANYGGGFLLMGFKEEEPDTFVADSENVGFLAKWNQDNLNGIVASYMYPVFHVGTHLLASEKWKQEILVVAVPGGHKVPIQCVKGSPDQKLINGKYYTRRPGPKSAEPDTPEEWSLIMTNCLRSAKDELLDTIRLIVGGYTGPLNDLGNQAAPELDALIREAEQGMVGK